MMDGMVQVYAQTGCPTNHDSVQWDKEDMNGYQLLNEVGSGGTLSSLFTILSLFTEDVKISWQDAVADADRTHSARAQGDLGEGMTNTRAPLNHADSNTSNSGLKTGRTVNAQPAKSGEHSPTPCSSGSLPPMLPHDLTTHLSPTTPSHHVDMPQLPPCPSCGPHPI